MVVKKCKKIGCEKYLFVGFFRCWTSTLDEIRGIYHRAGYEVKFSNEAEYGEVCAYRSVKKHTDLIPQS